MQRVLVSAHGAQKVVWFGFLGTTPLRLCCADAAGTLFAWEFSADDSAWIAVGSCPGFFSPPPAVAVFDAPRNTFVWTDSAASASAVFSRSVAFEAKPNPKLPGRRNMVHSVAPGPVQLRRTDIDGGATGGGWHAFATAAPDIGLWLVNEEAFAVKLFSFRTQTFIPVQLGPEHARFHSGAVHPLTGELVLLDVNGGLFVCTTAADGAAAAVRLCAIDEQPSALPSASTSTFAVARHCACLATTTKCRFYDLLCGVRMGEIDLPASAPPSQKPHFLGPAQGDAASLCGLWWPGSQVPLFQIIWPSPTAYAELLVNTAIACSNASGSGDSTTTTTVAVGDDEEAMFNSPTAIRRDAAALAAVSVCADWGLEQWVAQSAFDLLLKGIPHRHVEQVARALSARLQNPALVVSLLAARNMGSFIEDEISRFLSDFTASSASDSRDVRRAAARAAYQSFTPLNVKVFPDLLKFLQLLRSQEQGCRPAAASHANTAPDYPLTPAEVPVAAILSLDWQTLWRLAEEYPQPLCDKLLAALGVRVADLEHFSPDMPCRVHPALLQEEPHAPGSSTPAREVGAKAAARQPQAMFELCCSTLFACNPRLLIAFVMMVSVADKQQQLQQRQQQHSQAASDVSLLYASKKRSFFERALFAIPLVVFEGSSPAHQTTAAAMLLAMSGRPLPAMLLLLRAGLWEDALQLLTEADAANKAELFAVALHSCLQTHKLERLERLWKLAPPQLTALDIVHAVAMHTAQNEAPADVTVTDPAKQFPLSAIKQALIDFVRRSPR